MSGLVAYGSSDEEDSEHEIQQEQQIPQSRLKAVETSIGPQTTTAIVNQGSKPNSHTPSNAPTTSIAPLGLSANLQAPIVGPALGPQRPSEIENSLPQPEDEGTSTPLSPYSANLALLRTLTMPSVPNFAIPSSTPGEPLPSTTKKFLHFLQLKKQGVHFNEKLAKSSALKNPSLMEKLLDFADIQERDSFATTLPQELWDPKGFPEWVYKEELAKSNAAVAKRLGEEKLGVAREFVPASASGESSRSGTPGLAARGARPKSAAERVMAGLDTGEKSSPKVQAGMKRKTRFES